MTDFHPLVTFLPAVAAALPEVWRRELHLRNSDEPAPAEAPWVLINLAPPDLR